MFFWGGFLARAIDQILSRVDLRFFLPPSLPITLSSHLNQAISTLYPRPRSSFSEISISNSLFFSLFQGGVLFTTQVYYLPIRITPFPETRKREREREQDKKRTPKKRKKRKRGSSCLPYSNQNIHTYIPPTYTPIVGSNPPSVFKRV